MFQASYVRPSREQIEKAAYTRWERRGRVHGWDAQDWLAAEMDLTFDLNYRTLLRHEFASQVEARPELARGIRCRFCEQAPPKVRFTHARWPTPAVWGECELVARDICDECVEWFRTDLDPSLSSLWVTLPDQIHGASAGARIRVPLVVFKALSWLALSVMPEAELEHFQDTLEWVGNPDHDEDWSLITGLSCLVYSAPMPYWPAWISLERRNEDDAAIPSVLLSVASGDFCLQVPIPMGVLDQELDGEELQLLRRASPLKGSLDIDVCRLLVPAPAAAPARRAGRWLS